MVVAYWGAVDFDLAPTSSRSLPASAVTTPGSPQAEKTPQRTERSFVLEPRHAMKERRNTPLIPALGLLTSGQLISFEENISDN
jgi:hypothetical protein